MSLACAAITAWSRWQPRRLTQTSSMEQDTTGAFEWIYAFLH